MTSVYISAAKTDVPASVNAEAHANLGYVLINRFGRRNVVPARGSYCGTEEPSYRVEGVTPDDFAFLDHLAFILRQESILVVNAVGGAALRFTEVEDLVDRAQCRPGRVQILGHLIEVTEARARAEEAWSEVDGHWYIVE